MLDQTLVVLGSEFGRTSRINDNDGRTTATRASCACWPGLGSSVSRRSWSKR